MSEVLNDRDAILQAAAVRIVNPKNASILLTAVPAMFHLSAAGVPDASEITITAALLGLEGDVTFEAAGAALASITGKSAVVRLADMQGPTAIVRARLVAGGESFVGTCIIGTLTDGASGGTAKMIALTPSEQVFKISKAGANAPGSITLTATGQNLGGAPSFTIPAGTATLTAGANSLQKVLTFANMATDSVTVQVAQDGVADRVTIIKVREGADGQPGADAIIGLLSNESVTLPASSAGVVSSYSGAVCTMSVFKGAADDSANWAYAFSPASAAASLTYTASGRSVTITGLAAGVDVAYVDITATKSGAASITRRFTVTKSKAGASVTGARGAGRYYASGTAWSDGAADAATPGENVAGDVVQISSGTYVMEKRWTGAEWVDNGVRIDGRVIIPGSVLAGSIDARGLSILDSAGNVVLAANAPLAAQLSAGPNLAPRASAWTWNYSTWIYNDPSGRPVNGEMIILDARPGTYVGRETKVPLVAGDWYTVSFWAVCDVASGTEGCIDVVGVNYDSQGIIFRVGSGVAKYFKITEKVPAGASDLRLRVFATSHQAQLGVWDVKVERGQRDTAWTDSVIHPSNVDQFVLPGAIGNTQIGGDLFSTNWNGIAGPGGAGWLMQRTGRLYASDVQLRGTMSSGAYNHEYKWPGANNGSGFHLGPGGLLLGNPDTPGLGYFQLDVSTGNLYSRNFSIVNGNATFRGSVTGSVISTSVMRLESARLLTAWNRLAPFSIFDCGSVYNTTIRNATVTLEGFVGPVQGAENTYNGKRFGSFKKDVFLKATMHGDVTWENLYIEARYHDASQGWATIASGSVFCEGRAGISIVVRYTPADGGWDNIAFRARTSQGRCLSLVFEMQVFNFNESINAPYSSSGMPTGDSGGGGVGSNPEPWCVDYETTRLPDGRFARDVAVNDLMECWDFNLENPGVEYAPANKVAFGEEASTMLVTKTGVQIIQSNSTPMTVRDGRVVLTPGMLGEEVVVKRGSDLVWEPITQTFDMGVRRVVKISLHDRMYFAGMDPRATIATHNLEYKP